MIYRRPVPFAEALATQEARALLPTTLDSAALAELDADLLRRAQFSATVADAIHLEKLSQGYQDMLAGRIDRATLRLQIKQYLWRTGYQPMPEKEGTLQDLASDKRINLQIDTNVEMMRGAGSYLQGQAEPILDMWPAQELVRVIESKDKRDWEKRWRAAGGPVTRAWPRLIALKDDPVWTHKELNRFGNPYTPFDYNSGMGLRDVTRREAMRLGLIDLNRRVEPDREALRELKAGLVAGQVTEDPRLRTAMEATGVGRFDAEGVFRGMDDFNDGGPLANTRGYRRDSLGQFAKDGGPMTPEKNIARGRAAVERALRTEADVPNAMNVPGLGRVDFLWGRSGHTQPNEAGKTHTDGYGISHIVAKHGEGAARAVPVVLAQGKITRHPKDEAKREVRYKNYFMVVRRQSDTGAYVITNFDEVNGP